MQTDIEEMHKKIKVHRRKLITIGAFILLALLVISIVAYVYFKNKVYDSYRVLQAANRDDSYGSEFIEFNDKILKYSKDGAFYMEGNNRSLWNLTYEIQNPISDVCEGYAVIAEKDGKKIYIADAKGNFDQIETKLPIQKIHVANQGVVAVLLKDGMAAEILVYDKKGKILVEAKIATTGSGAPLDLALSNDGKKLALSILDYQDGKLKTNIIFYGLDTYGQSQRDNILASYPYMDTVIPRIEFLDNERLAAFGNNKVIFFEGKQKPEEAKNISIKNEIYSIFYNNKYYGFTVRNENEANQFDLFIYDFEGNEIQKMEFAMNYDEIDFLQNNEILIKNDSECILFTLSGIEKFHYKFDKKLIEMFSTKSMRNYIILLEGTTEKIRLK